MISTRARDVYEFTLKRADAKRPEAVAARITALGCTVI